MVAPCAPKTPTIDRSACPARRHGTRSARYDAGCVCPDGYLDAKRARVRKETRRLLVGRLVSGIGAARRLQGLGVLGYGLPVLAERLGQDRAEVGRLRRGRAQILATTHRAVLHLTDELVALPAPADGPGKRSGVARARAHAARQDWVALDEWLDIDDPAELPDRYYRRADAALIPTADLLELAMHMRVDGRPDYEAIGRRVGMTAEAVQKRLERRPGGATRLTADQVYAIRDEYLRTRGDGWNGKATAKCYGVSTFVVSTIIHGTTRPELGLTDLTVQQGGHTPAAPPTGRENRKGTAA